MSNTRISRGLGLAICAVAMLALDGSASAQTGPRVELGKTSDKQIGFDHDGKDADGAPTTIDAAEFIFRSAAGAPIRVLVTGNVVAGENLYQVASVIGGVPDGDYNATVRVRGTNGNWSDETPVLQVAVSSKKPTAPTGFSERG